MTPEEKTALEARRMRRARRVGREQGLTVRKSRREHPFGRYFLHDSEGRIVSYLSGASLHEIEVRLGLGHLPPP